MNVEYKASFARDLRKIKDKQIQRRLQDVIIKVEEADALSDLINLKKLKGEDNYYRVRVGDYRCGLIVQDETVTFVRFLHRKEIYRYFP
jgi:mRNA interferase RelE/StbE